MKSKIVNLSKNTFIQNVFITATGTAAAQLITLMFTPLITRIYGPEAYGLMGVFLSMTNIFTPIAALTYPIAIVLPKKNSEAKALIRLSIYITIIVSIVVGVILFLFNDQIVYFFNLENISVFIYLIPLVLLFTGFMQVAEQWLIRTKQFKINAKVTFSHSLILNVSKVFLGLIKPFASSLILLTAVGNGIKALMLFIQTKTQWHISHYPKVDGKTSLKALAKKYKDFPLYRSPQAIIFAFSSSLPILMLSNLFGPASAGFYSLGNSILNAPANLIGKSVGDVFYSKISEVKNNDGDITELIKKATIGLLIVGVVPFGIVILFGPMIFRFVFGSEWISAGEYARWISLWVFFKLLHQPSVKALPVLSAQKLHLIYTVISLLVNVASLYAGYYFFKSDISSIAFFGTSNAILSVLLIAITLKISKKNNL